MSAKEKKAKRRVSRARHRRSSASSHEDEDVKPESEHSNTSSNDVNKQKGTKESHKKTTEESDESQSDDDDSSDAASTATESVTLKRRSSTRNKTKQRSNDETKTGPSWGDYDSKREVKRNTIAPESISSHHFTNPKSAILQKEDLPVGDIDNPGLLGIYYDSVTRQYFFFSSIEGQSKDFYCIPENEVYRSMFTLLHSISMYFLR